ncbi:hypothetical protein MLD38_033347 [Melastoma candidum]|uniref:Uncharacterized protein n=1 Tax=Melastoma candidum TaxID=119954 RepID=A0ACB9M8J2_9MYRT|nr:hypothetical protein MLD38_033347 [Melastoma candidum]
MALILRILISLSVVALTALFTYLCNLLLLRPGRLRKRLQELGVNGPPPSSFVGNIPDVRRIMLETVKNHNPGGISDGVSHDYMSQVFPHILKWQKEYGPTFSFSLGTIVVVCISDFDVVKEFCQNKSIEFGRSSYLKTARGMLLGEDGLITSKGKSWAYQRKKIAPEFFNDKLKGMVDLMVESVTSMVEKWDSLLSGTSESIRVDEDLKFLSAEVISKACFGSNYTFAREIFAKMLKLQDLLSPQHAFVGLPGFRHIPIKSNRDIWKLGKEIRLSILKACQHQENGQARFFLQALIEHFGAGSSDQIVDNCKAMFLAGYETTATAAAFALVLLAHNQEWQTHARDEVIEVLGGQAPCMEKLQKMKVLNMVIYETLRTWGTTKDEETLICLRVSYK